jgi:predicted secreted protein
MKIAFDVDGMPAELTRNWFTGSFVLTAGGQTWQLQSPFNPTTHFSFAMHRHWHVSINGHDVRIEKQRPVLIAGFRSHTYRVFIDGKQALEQSGM